MKRVFTVLLILLLCPIAWGNEMYQQKIEKIFNGLNKNTMYLVDEFYHENALFLDPIGEHKGLPVIRKYYENLYQNVESIRFDFSSHICQNNECASVWAMYLAAKGLNGGKEIKVDGNSVFKFDETGKVIYQRDYFDMGEFIYQHIPILKNIISYIKERLKS